MRLWSKKKKAIELEGIAATAVRAVMAENRHFPVMEIQFEIGKVRNGETVSEELKDIEKVTIYLDLAPTSKLTQELLNAISAATPSVPRAPYQIPWGE